MSAFASLGLKIFLLYMSKRLHLRSWISTTVHSTWAMIQSLCEHYLWDGPFYLWNYSSQICLRLDGTHILPRRGFVSYPESHLKEKVQYYLPLSTSGLQKRLIIILHLWYTLTTACAWLSFIYLNTINTSEMSIQQVEQYWQYLPFCSSVPASRFPHPNHLNLVFIMPLLLESRLFCLSLIYRTAAAEVVSRVPVYSRISNCPTFRISMLLHRACKWQCQFSPQHQVKLNLTCTLFSAEELQLQLC